MEDQPVARPLPSQGNINIEMTETDIRVPTEIRTHDRNVRASDYVLQTAIGDQVI
jgi:hypothetical protein